MSSYSLDLQKSSAVPKITATIRSAPTVTEKRLQGTSDEAVVVNTDPIETGTPLTVSTVAIALDQTVDALNAIEALRVQQKDLATEGASLAPINARLSTLATASTTIETEISRIATAANATLTTRGVGYSLDMPAYDLTASVQIGGTSSLTANSGVSFATASAADTAEETLSDSLVALRSFIVGIEGAPQRARTIIPEEKRGYNVPNPEPDTLKELPGGKPEPMKLADVKELAEKTAYAISSPYNSRKVQGEIVEASAGKLNPDRVAQLLE